MRAALVILSAVMVTTACTSVHSSSVRTPPSCSELLEGAIAYERSGTGDIDMILQTLSDNCSDEYEIAIHYLANSRESAYSIDSCDELLGYGMREESVALLEEDGRCSFDEAESVPDSEWPEGGLGWDRAREYAGTVQRVCGPLMSARGTEHGTFVNVGKDYPSPDRFTFIFWDMYLEPIAPGAIVCGSGEIYLYEGSVAQIEMWDPTGLEVWS